MSDSISPTPYKIYKGLFANKVKFILDNVDEARYTTGKVGNKVNVKQKRRKDLFISNDQIIKTIDNYFYDNLYSEIMANFSDIKYREKWKLGHYNHEDNGFYNLHTDTAGDTKYRKTSCVTMLSSSDDYVGGELHFPELDKKFKLDKGDVIIFRSELLHGVHPVTEGERYVLISFFFDDEGMEIKERAGKVNHDNYKPHLSNIRLEYPLINHNTVGEINKGDIDYSDLHHKDKWNDTDAYHYENNNSDTLIVTFAGMGWKKSIPTFIFHNFLTPYTVDKLFLRDIKMRYYLTGLKHCTDNFEQTVEFIKNMTIDKGYKKIIAIGCSSGGYAAILYGNLLNFTKIIAFNPQTVLNDKKESLIGDIYNAPKTCRWLRNLHKEDANYQKTLDLMNYSPFSSEIDIHYSVGGNKGIDRNHALYLASDLKCNIHEHPGNDHMIALSLRDNGKLKDIIINVIET